MGLWDFVSPALAAATAPGELIRKVTFESNATPRIEINDPLGESGGAGAGGGAGAAALRLLAPKVTVETAAGTYQVAPGGEPGTHGAGVLVGIVAAGVVVAGLAAYGAYALVKRAR